MKKNLRRICFVLLMAIAICKCVYARSEETGTVGLFSGYMKFVFAGAAVILLVLVLSLSYKLDTEEPANPNEGKVSKKKLGSSIKTKSKDTKKATNAAPIEDDFNDEFFENNLSQSDFDSEEVAGFKDDKNSEKIVQPIDDYDEELESVEDSDENDFNDFDDETEDLSGLSTELEDDIDDLDDDVEYEDDETEEYDDDTEEYEDEEDDVPDFDDSMLDDIEDYDDGTMSKKPELNYDDETEEDNNNDMFFDTSVIDDLEDFDDNKKTTDNSLSKPLSSSSMPKKSSRNRFEVAGDTSTIGFRNKSNNENTGSIGFRNKKVDEGESTIGFRRKSSVDEDFKSEDFLSQMEENMKQSTTTTRKVSSKKIDSTESKKSTTGTTTKKKKLK